MTAFEPLAQTRIVSGSGDVEEERFRVEVRQRSADGPVGHPLQSPVGILLVERPDGERSGVGVVDEYWVGGGLKRPRLKSVPRTR